MRVDVWTDGSAYSTGSPGGWGYVLSCKRDGEEIVKRNSGSHPETTNHNRMELTAAIEALRAIKVPCNVVLRSDSEYLVNPYARGYIAKWRRQSFAKRANVDLWLALDAEVARHRTVQFVWVRGHDGDPNNEICDKLAGEARKACPQPT